MQPGIITLCFLSPLQSGHRKDCGNGGSSGDGCSAGSSSGCGGGDSGAGGGGGDSGAGGGGVSIGHGVIVAVVLVTHSAVMV